MSVILNLKTIAKASRLSGTLTGQPLLEIDPFSNRSDCVSHHEASQDLIDLLQTMQEKSRVWKHHNAAETCQKLRGGPAARSVSLMLATPLVVDEIPNQPTKQLFRRELD
jgi:hypothetical protein